MPADGPEDLNELIDELYELRHHPRRAVRLRFHWHRPEPERPYPLHLFEGEHHMPVTLAPGQTVSGAVAPVDAQGNPSKATLSNLVFGTSDATVFTVAPDPNTPNGFIVTAAANPPTNPDAAAITAAATATEPDGVTTETITGTDTVTVQSVTPPPGVAASLVFTFGAPQARPMAGAPGLRSR